MRARYTWETQKCSTDDSKKKKNICGELHNDDALHSLLNAFNFNADPYAALLEVRAVSSAQDIPGMPVYLEIDDWPRMRSIQVVALSRATAHMHAFFQHTILSFSNEWKLFHVKAHTEKLSINIVHPLAQLLNLGSCKVYIQGARSLKLRKKTKKLRE